LGVRQPGEVVGDRSWAQIQHAGELLNGLRLLRQQANDLQAGGIRFDFDRKTTETLLRDVMEALRSTKGR